MVLTSIVSSDVTVCHDILEDPPVMDLHAYDGQLDMVHVRSSLYLLVEGHQSCTAQHADVMQRCTGRTAVGRSGLRQRCAAAEQTFSVCEPRGLLIMHAV